MSLGARVSSTLVLSLALGGCRFVGATDTNLRELHTEEGMHRRTARVTTHYGYATRVGVIGLLRSFGAKPQEATLEKVEDPLSVCVEALNELAEYDSSEAWVRALQIEHFSRVAVFDPWKLSREIAVEALGELGAKLPAWTPSPDPAGVRAAGVDELAPALQRLVRAANRLARGATDSLGLGNEAGGDGASQSEETLEQATRAFDELVLDLEGAPRALRVCGLLERTRLAADPQFEPVRALRVKLEQRCVALALRSALNDTPPSAYERLGTDPGWGKPNVQAAAVRANVRVWGAARLAELLDTAKPREYDALRMAALLDEVARLGLPPAPAEADAEQAERLHTAWKRRVWLLATDHPDGLVRMAGMRALARIRGVANGPLREEESLEWARGEGLLEAPVIPERQPARDAAESGETP